jgi:hypothetical protein
VYQKWTPRILLDSDEYPECVETTPRVFGPVTGHGIDGDQIRTSYDSKKLWTVLLLGVEAF